MKYRKFGRLDREFSILGFGCMRLPIEKGSEKIDEAEAARMLRYAIDRGVNYVDTAYGYHKGESERFLGRALGGGYRERVGLATKLPCWLVKEAGDFDRLLDEQLSKLNTDHVDFYLMHGLGREGWHKLRDLGIPRLAEKAVADGRVRYLGFSFHEDYEAFKEIVDAYDWTFCQIQYNYMDIQNQAGEKGLKYAADKGLAVVIMEPLLGGKLVNPPERVKTIWERASHRRTPADWALQWLWNQPEVSVVLSGMSSMKQAEENLASADASAAGSLTGEEEELVAEVRRCYLDIAPAPCTKCSYCMPCPNGVEIPRAFDLYNQSVMYGLEQARKEYNWTPKEKRASACIACRKCEELCPQQIPISEWMTRINATLEGQG